MKPRKPIKRSKSPHKILEKECDALWSKAVKLRAGNKSEISGKTDVLNAHHLVGKPNYRLRYELSNGISLTSGEHFFVAHNAGRVEGFKNTVKILRGHDIFEKLHNLKWDQCKTDLTMVKLYLENEIRNLERGLK